MRVHDNNYDNRVQEITEDKQYSFCFKMNAAFTISFPFGDRQALITIDSNCSRLMTRYCMLVGTKPCKICVDAFEQQAPGVGNIFQTLC